MTEEKETSVMGGILKRSYAAVFYENWPIWLGGILIGLMSVLTFAWARPLGRGGGTKELGRLVFSSGGTLQQSPFVTHHFHQFHPDPWSFMGGFRSRTFVQTVCHPYGPRPGID